LGKSYKLKVIFDNLAVSELHDATQYYELEVNGLGKRFKKEVKKSIKRIINNPFAWRREQGDIRRYLMHTFPYKIIYSIEKNYIYIIAIAHYHRKPYFWSSRINNNQ